MGSISSKVSRANLSTFEMPPTSARRWSRSCRCCTATSPSWSHQLENVKKLWLRGRGSCPRRATSSPTSTSSGLSTSQKIRSVKLYFMGPRGVHCGQKPSFSRKKWFFEYSNHGTRICCCRKTVLKEARLKKLFSISILPLKNTLCRPYLEFKFGINCILTLS